MAYDALLERRVLRAVGELEGVTTKKMFGGVAFLLDGKMFCGVAKEDLMVRVGEAAHAKVLGEPHVRPMDFTGRPMKGYVYVGPAGTKTDKMAERWALRGMKFVAGLEKVAKGKKAKGRA